jgi:tRNA acetyltransferase TAN1
MRNHSTLSRPTIIEELAKCVPPEYKVELTDPEVFVLVEVWKVSRGVVCLESMLIKRVKSVCGIGIVRDYYKLQKFNVMEIAKAEEAGFGDKDGRVPAKGMPSVETSES